MKNDTWVKVLLIGAILMLIAQVGKIPMLFAISFPIVIVGWMALGAIRRGQIGKSLKLSLIALSVIWVIGFIVLNLMDHSKFSGTVLGLVPGTAIMIYIIWLLPFFIGTLVYSLKFNEEYLDEEDIKKFENRSSEVIETK